MASGGGRPRHPTPTADASSTAAFGPDGGHHHNRHEVATRPDRYLHTALTAIGRGAQMPHRYCHNRRDAGFTLIELIMVTAIIAVVASIAAPRYTANLNRYRADAAARQVTTELMRGRAIARQTSSDYRIQFDLAHHRMFMPDTPGEHDTTPTTRLNSNPFYAELVAVDFDGTPELRFDGHGQPAHGGTITLRNGPTLRTITVHPVSGAAHIEP
ncbi:GspH/FimT family pseudopilin [Phycisphaerales bacterium AB-hyl4]|uniref:Type II secretion system protein H n=1 Tax=Natronomicrosphaera hydrolytica TaxID=3242702 RepID=A0ABV4U389_9BACT